MSTHTKLNEVLNKTHFLGLYIIPVRAPNSPALHPAHQKKLFFWFLCFPLSSIKFSGEVEIHHLPNNSRFDFDNQISILLVFAEEDQDESENQRTQAGAETEPVAPAGQGRSGIAEPGRHRVADVVAAELVRVVGGGRGGEILEQPGGDVDDACGLPAVPHVRYAGGGGPQMPQM